MSVARWLGTLGEGNTITCPCCEKVADLGEGWREVTECPYCGAVLQLEAVIVRRLTAPLDPPPDGSFKGRSPWTKVPVGTPVIVTRRDNSEHHTKLRGGPARVGDTLVLWLDGMKGCYPAETVRVDKPTPKRKAR